MMDIIYSNYNYWVAIILMMVGLYAVITRSNLIKKMMGLAIFQVSVLLMYISISHVKDASIPILKEQVINYVNPLPHVLMLTAIVVGVAIMAVGLALIVRIKDAYGTIEEDQMLKIDSDLNIKENKNDVLDK